MSLSAQSNSIAKACIIPVCNNKKFNLVHKFPADKERFAEWIEAIQVHQPIEKLTGMTDDAIRKRFFICSRHFGLAQYKNIESRSLNLTAIPHLNLKELNDILLSKAWQIESNSEIIATPIDEEFSDKPASVAKVTLPKLPERISGVRILNPGVSMKESPEAFKLHQPPSSLDEGQKKIKPRAKFSVIHDRKDSEPPAKRIKQSQNELSIAPKNPQTIIAEPSKIVKNKSSFFRRKVSGEKIEPKLEKLECVEISPTKSDNVEHEQITPIEETKPSNKLLALFEVTPEQYEKLNKSLSSAERGENIANLLSFIDKEENEAVLADNEIEVALEGDQILKVDLFWLRDHCRCEKCYDHTNYQRKINILDISDDITAKSYKVEHHKLIVIWNDDHESSYDLEFLIRNQLSDGGTNAELCLWDKAALEMHLKSNCRVSMRDYMSDPEVCKKVLESLNLYGVAFIDGVQPTQQNTEFVIRQLFPVHKTLFGEMWTFSDAKKDHSDTAYTNKFLGAHNDNTYFNDAAGLQILHCILQSGTGGESFLVDGFQVANNIKLEHPEVFKRLTNTIVTGEYIEDGRHHKHAAPIINLNRVTGEIEQIRFNLDDRAPIKNVPAGKVREFYRDLKVLANEIENPDNRAVFKLQPGTVMIFDNWRILHGRLAYTGKRTMTGCYVARTEYQSALRVNNFIE